MKGGKEAYHSNRVLVKLIRGVLGSNNCNPKNSVSLVETRIEVDEIVKLSEDLDLIIPRGSNQMVQHIQRESLVPVLGHADGICHVYLDAEADMEKAREIVIDAKTEYPAVCNAMETLLVDIRFDNLSLTVVTKWTEHRTKFKPSYLFYAI